MVANHYALVQCKVRARRILLIIFETSCATDIYYVLISKRLKLGFPLLIIHLSGREI